MTRSLRTVAAATHPALGSRLARLTRLRAAVEARTPRPTVIGVASFGEAAGASTLAALVAQRLAALAPERVAVLDTDARNHPQRTLLGAGEHGDLRRLVADDAAHRQRRRTEAHLAQEGAVALLAGSGAPFGVDELVTALDAVRHRYPFVVIDATHTVEEAERRWLASRADHLLAVVPVASLAARETGQWLAERSAAQPPTATVVRSWARQPAALLRRAVERNSGSLRWPAVSELAAPGPVLLDRLGLPARTAVEECVARIASAWPTR